MLIFFKCLGVIAGGLILVKILVGLIDSHSKSNDVHNTSFHDAEMSAFKEALKTYQISKFIASYVQSETKIKSNLIIFEEVFFFSFIERIIFSELKTTELIKKNYFPILRDTLNHELKNEYEKYKDILESLINSRNRMYWDIMRKYGKSITSAFIKEAFCIQSELISHIELFNDFMDMPIQSITFKDENKENIYNSLNDNYKLVINFIPKNIRKIIQD